MMQVTGRRDIKQWTIEINWNQIHSVHSDNTKVKITINNKYIIESEKKVSVCIPSYKGSVLILLESPSCLPPA